MMSQKLTAPRGTLDVLPPESALYNFIAQTARDVFEQYGFLEIQTPVFEHTELFVRGVGETTDVVSKEMYTFLDKKERSLTLRPEGTAGAIRAYIEHNLGSALPIQKLFYIGPMFRYERPQAGRLRQHTQVGCECIGASTPQADAEIIDLFCRFTGKLGLKNIKVMLNTLGDNDCRPTYKAALQDYFRENLPNLCPDCQQRFEKNPLRILDCKSDGCKTIVGSCPVMLDYLCDPCKEHFETVKSLLSDLKINYEVNPLLVRGLDYYTHTVFEVQVSGLGAQNAIGGGGRYNHLVEELGGASVPALGFGSGIERIALTLKNHQIELPELTKKPVFIAALGTPAITQSLVLAQELRNHGIPVMLDYRFGSFKSQFKYADNPRG
jgi:histidyl-tRNA synthetase